MERVSCPASMKNKNQSPQNKNQSMDASAVYTAACSIIDYKTPVFENIMSVVVKYLDKRKHLISAALMKLLKKAKLNIAVYCIKNKLNNAAAKCKKKNPSDSDDDVPMQNLMYRSAVLRTQNVRTMGGASQIIDRQSKSPVSFKRPPPDILLNRIKRLKQWETTMATTTSTSSSSEDSDEALGDGQV